VAVDALRSVLDLVALRERDGGRMDARARPKRRMGVPVTDREWIRQVAEGYLCGHTHFRGVEFQLADGCLALSAELEQVEARADRLAEALQRVGREALAEYKGSQPREDM
jgi:hypothetical protein